MKTIKVCFDRPSFNYYTSAKGSDTDIRKQFVGKKFYCGENHNPGEMFECVAIVIMDNEPALM